MVLYAQKGMAPLVDTYDPQLHKLIGTLGITAAFGYGGTGKAPDSGAPPPYDAGVIPPWMGG